MLINSAIFLHCILVSTMFLQPKARQHPQEPEELFSNSNANAPPVPPRSSASSSLVTSPSASASSSSPLVPAFFIIGDSSVDCGNNNFLGTLARADHLPYGRDFDTHKPTGRFCNGRIPVDYLALRLGLPFVPSYLGQSGVVEDMIHGVNYASAGAGIIFSSGSELGQHISFTQQIEQVTDTFQQFILSLGEAAANDLISNSLFYISIGINDYIHYYLLNMSNVQNLYLPWSFNQFLATTVKQEIMNLYNANVRKVVVMGLAPIGCSPYYLWLYGSQNGECVKEINDMIMEFNFVMRYMLEELGEELHDANIIFCDVFEVLISTSRFQFHCRCLLWTRQVPGLDHVPFTRNGLQQRLKSYLVDQFHPTDVVNAILADNVWSSLHTGMCYPSNLQDMLVAKAR
ncbi:GDSL esterase/lipase 7 [Vitis vinifera]|uniref:GDSL esterase/lipase 7 n=1 Tax=Vitis vinifera TaxID=29760 RepID=A0A438E628_VITVI|nr:GDSL esterase/lipase 7 [Vitis vinifera]